MAIALAGLAATAGVQAGGDRDWQWRLEPYVWAASIGTDMRTLRPPAEGSSET